MMLRLWRIVVAILLPLLLLGLVAFFVVQTYTGSYGRLALEGSAARKAAAERMVRRVEAEVDAKRRRNEGLRDASVNLDLLDERARIELGMIRNDEVLLVEEGGRGR